MFHPRSIAVLGATTNEDASGAGGMGLAYVNGLKAFKFPGPIYPVNPKASGTIAELPAYTSLLDVPGPVDQAYFCIPASAMPKAIQDCAAKGVKAIQCFTAGFSETGDTTRIALEKEVLRLVRETGIRLIGPNCMGLYCPGAGLSWGEYLPREAGNVGIISQSGNISLYLIDVTEVRGLRFSKVVSYGNALDINEADLLDYFLHDPETQVIGAYIEGLRDGPRFQRLLREAKKPVVIVKGGQTEAGARAVASHTGSLAGYRAVWDALCQQRSVIQVQTFDEMADVFVALLTFPKLPNGRGIGITGLGGGASVMASEACQRAGLDVPILPEEVQKQLRAFTPEVGSSVRNPVDSNTVFQQESLVNTLKVMAGSPEISCLLIHISTNLPIRKGMSDPADAVLEAAQQVDKPMAVVMLRGLHPDRLGRVLSTQEKLQKAGIPVFYSLDSAASAISKVIWYHEAKDSSWDTPARRG